MRWPQNDSMYAEYTMTFWEVMDWLGGWNSETARQKMFNNLYTANQDICNVLMEAFLYREIGYEIVERFVHEFGEQFTRNLPEYLIRKKMWEELQKDTELLYNGGEDVERILHDVVEGNKHDTHSGTDSNTAQQHTDSTSNANQNSTGKTVTDQDINTNANMIHSDTPGNNLDWSKNYADVAQKDIGVQNTDETVTTTNNVESNTNNIANGNTSTTINYGKKIDQTNNNYRNVVETIKRKMLNGKTKFQVYELFTATTPEKWFIKQFDKQFMLIFGG